MDKNLKDNTTKRMISVVMPVYNAEQYIAVAIKSILAQTYGNFEFLILEDGSTDGTLQIINSFDDSRIKLIRNDANKGIVYNLNYGLEVAGGRYVARMDADDIAHPERLALQYEFMEAHPDIAICGTWFEIMEENVVVELPVDHDQIKIGLLDYCVIGHPTAMLRADFFKTNNLKYNSSMQNAEDYDLWVRVAETGKLANLPHVLLRYRKHEQQVSKVASSSQQIITNIVRTNLLYSADKSLAPDYHFYHPGSISNNTTDFNDNIFSRILLLKKIEISNRNQQTFNPELFRNYVQKKQQYFLNMLLKESLAKNIQTAKIFFRKKNVQVLGFFPLVKLALNYIFKIRFPKRYAG
ncbi:glycosyltransferase family A protein [Pedobacter sp. BMA]|uniref:glycosyltransferase family 2 protein n=1 Tax=Pedobacter sp. BMA TaxID=1663685 RepID=UPI00069DBCCE|nr:glycosyltransferase family A protein [Pedobacter sp. BMA]